MFHADCGSGPTQALRVTSEKMVSPQSVLIRVVVSSKVQDLPLPLIGLPKMPGRQFLQAAKGPLSVSKPTHCIHSHSSQLCIVRRLAEGGTAPLPRLLPKTLNSMGPSEGQHPSPGDVQVDFVRLRATL